MALHGGRLAFDTKLALATKDDDVFRNLYYRHYGLNPEAYESFKDDDDIVQTINAVSAMEERLERGCPKHFRRLADSIITAVMAGQAPRVNKLKKKIAAQVGNLGKLAKKAAGYS